MRKRQYSRKPGATVVTKEMATLIINAVRVGVPTAEACAIARIDPSTLQRARVKNPKLNEQLKEAEATLIQGLTSMILMAGKNGQWTAAAWMCERRWPHLFAKVERQEVSGPGGAPLAITSASQDEYVRAVRRALGFNEPEDGVTTPVALEPPHSSVSVEICAPEKVGRDLMMPAGNGDTAGEGQGARPCPSPLEEASASAEEVT